MTTPDSPTASLELEVLGHAIKRSSQTATILNVGAGLFLAAWIAAHFFYPLPILGWMALGFFSLAHLYQMGRSLIDHHAAMNTLIPLELQLMQARAAQDAVGRLDEFRKAMAEKGSSLEQPGAKISAGSAIGLSGRKVN